MRQLIATEGPLTEPTPQALKACLQTGEQGFWLHVENPDDSDYTVLQDTFGFHPLTLEDIRHQNQRPKLEEYEGYTFVVLFAADWDQDQLEIREHHLYLSTLAELRSRLRAAPELTRKGLPFIFYLVVDKLVDGLFPVIDRIDDETDALEDRIVDRPTPETLEQIYHLKHAAVDLRKALGAQRDLFQRLTTHSITGQEMTVYSRRLRPHHPPVRDG